MIVWRHKIPSYYSYRHIIQWKPIMNKINKNYIHIINSEILPIIDHFPFNFVKSIQSSLDELKEILQKYDVDYNDLRSVLDPTANVWAFVFDADSLYERIKTNYSEYLITEIINCLEPKSNCVFLTGDLLIENYNAYVYINVLKSVGINKEILSKTTLCAVVLINISESAANKINEHFKNEPNYLFYKNITTPSIEKYALTYCMIQKNIKLGKRLIYHVPEECDRSNYSGVVVSDSRYQLCPILDYYYHIFLDARPLQVIAPFDELKYSIKSFNGINNFTYPSLEITDDKLQYIKKKNVNLTKVDIEKALSDALKTNQVFHISYTGFGEEDSLDMNVASYIKDKKYTFGLKWSFKDNTVRLITAIPR